MLQRPTAAWPGVLTWTLLIAGAPPLPSIIPSSITSAPLSAEADNPAALTLSTLPVTFNPTATAAAVGSTPVPDVAPTGSMHMLYRAVTPTGLTALPISFGSNDP